jgi:1-phosphofructokinase
VAGAQRLRRRNVGTVLLTLGSAGAVLVSDEGAFAAAAPEIVARSTVGAGDSSLAGYLLAEVAGASPEQRLAQAVATGAAAAALPGSDVPALDHTDPTAVSVRVLDTHPAPEPA